MLKIRFSKISEDKAIVTVIEYQHDGLTDDNSMLVNSIPEEQPQVGKSGVLYVNPRTKELWYEYLDRPLTPEEKIAQLEEQLRITQEAVDALLLG
jgi:hypothetical protein